MASLLSRKIKSRLLLRDPSKAVSLFGEQVDDILEVHLILEIAVDEIRNWYIFLFLFINFSLWYG